MSLSSKKNIKILLPIVLVIWGILLYQFIDIINPDAVVPAQLSKSPFITPTIKKKDTFSLIPLKSDPFLGTIYNKDRVVTKRASKPKSETPWPTIGFFGIVADKKAASSVYIVSVNGKQYLLKKGDTIQKIKVVKGTKESIHIKHAGKTKEFKIM